MIFVVKIYIHADLARLFSHHRMSFIIKRHKKKEKSKENRTATIFLYTRQCLARR